MNREDIIRMGQEVYLCDKEGRDDNSIIIVGHLERFAALVASAEREACAMECLKKANAWTRLGAWGSNNEFHECAEAIRARGNVATNDTSQERVDETSESVHEPWSPVSIGVDVTKEGAHVVGIYALDKDTSQIFYAKHHPAPQRPWVGLTDEEVITMSRYDLEYAALIGEVQKKLKEKNNG